MMVVKENWRVAWVTKTTYHEVHAASLNTWEASCADHRAATANHGVAASKSGMSREASRGSAATLPPRR
jgi:hypothetical protein